MNSTEYTKIEKSTAQQSPSEDDLNLEELEFDFIAPISRKT